jgi:hypothetical protein
MLSVTSDSQSLGQDRYIKYVYIMDKIHPNEKRIDLEQNK